MAGGQYDYTQAKKKSVIVSLSSVTSGSERTSHRTLIISLFRFVR